MKLDELFNCNYLITTHLTVLNVLFLTVLRTGTHISIEHFYYK